MKRLVLMLAGASVMGMASGCAQYCKKAKLEVVDPTARVLSYLETNPTGEQLVAQGSEWVMAQFNKVPDGTAKLRKMAEAKYAHNWSKCIDYETTWRWVCDSYPAYGYHPYPGHDYGHGHGHGGYYPPAPYPYPYPGHSPYCHSVEYTYCAAWDHGTNYDPGYALALDLAKDLDVMYATASKMNQSSFTKDVAATYAYSRELHDLLATQVAPETQNIYQMACSKK